jgi:hypothetical protein
MTTELDVERAAVVLHAEKGEVAQAAVEAALSEVPPIEVCHALDKPREIGVLDLDGENLCLPQPVSCSLALFAYLDKQRVSAGKVLG